MKSSFLLMGALLIGLSAHAGSTICSGDSLYYNTQKIDFGMKPLPGSLSGSTLIVNNGKILLNEKTYVGTGKFAISRYQVELIGAETKVIQEEGNQKLGSQIITTTAVLYRVNSANASHKVEVRREEVVCKNSWRMAL